MTYVPLAAFAPVPPAAGVRIMLRDRRRQVYRRTPVRLTFAAPT